MDGMKEHAVEHAASLEDLGLEVVDDTPQIALGRPTRHIHIVADV